MSSRPVLDASFQTTEARLRDHDTSDELFWCVHGSAVWDNSGDTPSLLDPGREHDSLPVVLNEYAVGVTWTIEERRAWTFPPVEGIVDEIDLALLDPADPDDRGLLIRFEHPDFAAAVEAGSEEIEFDGNVINPNLHLTIHEVVANQLWEGEPPEAAETARRLDLAGYDRHEIFHMIGSVVSEEIWAMLRDKRMADLDLMRQDLAALPGTWEADRPV